MMIPPTDRWSDHTRPLTPDAMQRLAGALMHHAADHTLSPQDLLLLLWHYYRAALHYTLQHNNELKGVHLRQHHSYFVSNPLFFLKRPSAHSAAERAHLIRLAADASEREDAVSPAELAQIGFQPGHFQDLLALLPGQTDWADLLNVQLRQFDARSLWHVVAVFTNPRGEDLHLHLLYRDAEALGLTVGLEYEAHWNHVYPQTLPCTREELCSLAALDPASFPHRLGGLGAAVGT